MYVNNWEPELTKTVVFQNEKQKYKGEPNCNWPTPEIMEKWTLDSKMKLSKIYYKYAHECWPLSSLRFEFSNGIESPTFQTSEGKYFADKEIEIDTEKTIRKVSIYVEKQRHRFCKMIIKDDKDEEMCNIRMCECDRGDWVDIEIPEGKEIVGLFCNTESHHADMQGLGFNLWTPNPKAN